MKKLFTTLVFAISALAAFSAVVDSFPVLKTLDGQCFTNADIVSINPAYATVFFDGGGKRIALTNLTLELQKKYHYDARAAAEFISAQLKANRVAQENVARQVAADQRDQFARASKPKEELSISWTKAIDISQTLDPERISPAGEWIEGFVTNNTSSVFAWVEVKFSIFNDEGQLIDSLYASASDLDPKGVWKFKTGTFYGIIHSPKLVSLSGSKKTKRKDE